MPVTVITFEQINGTVHGVRQFALHILPNVAVEWLTFLFRIWEFQAANLGPETGYADWGFS
jgi:hypothetical protein